MTAEGEDSRTGAAAATAETKPAQQETTAGTTEVAAAAQHSEQPQESSTATSLSIGGGGDGGGGEGEGGNVLGHDGVVGAVLEVLRADRRIVAGAGDGSLPPELSEEAEGDLHEKPDWVDRDVQALREIVEAEPSLNSRLDKPFLLSFLRARKFDYDKAMAMLRSYYRARQENADLYVNLVPSALESVWPLHLQTVLPTPDTLGRTVLIFRAGAWDPELASLDDVFRSQVVVLEHVVRLPVTQLRGVAAVVDCAGLSMTHAYHLTPAHIRRMISVIQEVFPLRFKALHFVHEPAIFDWVFSLIKPFLSETIKGRLHFHGEDLSSLHQHIPPEELPEEVGGSMGPLDNSFLVDQLLKNEEYFRATPNTSPLPCFPTDHFQYGFEATPEPARTGGVLEAVTDVGSLLGSYYRRICID
ncbi:Alpha-tocopherol transfer protein-like [Portunus trituberculatus]|uniref:Alpha-tocopherol transfer protein-like n=1 Tax=Portunus trituberculatus TaxID=210409 RepID=A0A5B7FM25_PORTR|nr:Alpha-tocopherol transfer protein-like [Portunus trituberculatus]